MKFYSSHRPNDRVRVDGKQISVTRVYIGEALQAQGKDGATKDELLTLIGDEVGGRRPQGAIGQCLSTMLDDDEIVEYRGRYYLKDDAPAVQANGAHPAPLPTNGQRVQVAAQVQKRPGQTVSVFTSPQEWADVVRVTLVIKGVTVPIPLWGAMWICYGQQTPDWDVEKEQYYNVETIRLLFKNGTQQEIRPAPTDTVTIAQG